MLIPALFVADAARCRAASSANRYDVIVFCEPSVASPVHREWMERRGIILCGTMDLSRQRGVGKFSGRLTAAALMKLSIAGHLAGQYDKILYLDADLTIHGDVGALFALDMAGFALAAAWAFTSGAKISRSAALVGAAMGAASVSGHASMGMALAHGVPGNVVFPIAVGANLFIVAAGGFLWFRERLGPYGKAGVAIGLLTAVLLALPE